MNWISILLVSFFATATYSSPQYCEKVITPQTKSGTSCPLPPTRKNGKLCFWGKPTDLNRHASGYKEYILEKIENAISATKMGKRQGVDPTVLLSVLAKESWYNPTATNKWGDIGIAQFQLETANATLNFMRELGLDVPKEATKKLPTGCVENAYNSRLSTACFNGIKTDCSQPSHSNSLYCPGFALKLMAFHFLQIQEREIMVEYGDTSYNAVLLLAPGDTESKLRHLTSVYNRGLRIYNSAFYHFLTKGEWPIAKNYGPLWQQSRSAGKTRANDPFEGGTLSGHHINRCYVWAITGICGGIAKSLVHNYTDRLCPNRSRLLSNESELLTSYRKGDLAKTKTELTQTLTENLRSWSTQDRQTLNRLMLSVYETSPEFSAPRFLSHLINSTAQGVAPYGLSDAFIRYGLYPQVEQVIDRLGSLTASKNLDEIRLLRAIAQRESMKPEANPKWHFAAGKAGHLFFLSGEKALQRYTKTCATTGCHHLTEARSMLKLSKAFHQQRRENRENREI